MTSTHKHRSVPWLLLLGAVLLLMTSEWTRRGRVHALTDEVTRMGEDVERLRLEARALRRELGRVRLDMAARQDSTPPDGR